MTPPASQTVRRDRGSGEGEGEGDAASSRRPRPSRVEALLRRQVSLRHSRLRARLAELAAHAVRGGDGTLVVQPVLVGTFGHLHFERRLPLPEVWFASREAGVLQERMAAVAETVLASLLRPLLRGDGGGAQAAEVCVEEGAGGVTLRLGGSGQRAAAPLLRAAAAALPLLCRHILGSEAGSEEESEEAAEDRTASLGRALWLGADGVCSMALQLLEARAPHKHAHSVS